MVEIEVVEPTNIHKSGASLTKINKLTTCKDQDDSTHCIKKEKSVVTAKDAVKCYVKGQLASSGIVLAESLEAALVSSDAVKTLYQASNVKQYEKEVVAAVAVGCKGVAIAVINTVGCGIDTTSGGNAEPSVDVKSKLEGHLLEDILEEHEKCRLGISNETKV